jgi:hypothetical protein
MMLHRAALMSQASHAMYCANAYCTNVLRCADACVAAQVACDAPEALLENDVGVIAEFLAAKLKDW